MSATTLIGFMGALSVSLLLAAAEPAATGHPPATQTQTAPANQPAAKPATPPAAATTNAAGGGSAAAPAAKPAAASGSSSSSSSTTQAAGASGAAAADKGEATPSRIESTEKVRADFEVSFPVDI